MAKKHRIKVNFIYQLAYQILLVILPLVTAPYIARILGPENNGIYTYTHAIVNYFVVFAALGIEAYGNRLIAQSKNKDRQTLNKAFSSVFWMHFIVACAAATALALTACGAQSNSASATTSETSSAISAAATSTASATSPGFHHRYQLALFRTGGIQTYCNEKHDHKTGHCFLRFCLCKDPGPALAVYSHHGAEYFPEQCGSLGIRQKICPLYQGDIQRDLRAFQASCDPVPGCYSDEHLQND